MPFYEYQCYKCDYQFEVKQHFEDSPLIRCPNCEGKVSRVIQPVEFYFKEKNDATRK